jgi:fumarate reductase subunit C
MHKEAGHQVESAVEARAGFLDRPVLVVLCVSTLVAALMLGAVWIGMTFFGSGAV